MYPVWSMNRAGRSGKVSVSTGSLRRDDHVEERKRSGRMATMAVPESLEMVEVSIRVALRFDAGIVDRCQSRTFVEAVWLDPTQRRPPYLWSSADRGQDLSDSASRTSTAGMETTKSKKKVLILGRPKSGKLSLVKALTSSFPPELTDESTSHAGLTHSITLTTRYFSTEAGIWIDEIPEDSEAWLEEYLSEEATPVLQSLAAVILTVSAGPNLERDVDILKRLNERGEDVEWDATLVVGKKYPGSEAYSGLSSYCDDHTLEFINLNESGENEFGGTSHRNSAGLTWQRSWAYQESWRSYTHATGHHPRKVTKNQ
jgi:hypothetical protein